MSGNNLNRPKRLTFSGVIMIVFGLMWILLPIITIVPVALGRVHRDKTEEYVIINAEISRIVENRYFMTTERYYDVYLSYEYNGKKYKNIYYTRKEFKNVGVGEIIEVKVYKNNPGKVYSVEVRRNSLVSIVCALVMAAVGVWLVICGFRGDPKKNKEYIYSQVKVEDNTGNLSNYDSDYDSDYNNYCNDIIDDDMISKKRKAIVEINYEDYYEDENIIQNVILKNKELVNTGKCIVGIVERIESNIDEQGNSYVKVHCRYCDEEHNIVYKYLSEKIYEEIDFTIEKGSNINIYVEPKNWQEYFMDVPREYSVNSSYENKRKQ